MGFNESREADESRFDFQQLDRGRRTVLHLAASVNNYGMVEALLARESLNLDLFQRDAEGLTPKASCEDALSVVFKYLAREELKETKKRLSLDKVKPSKPRLVAEKGRKPG